MCEFFAHDLPSKMAATATVFRVCDSDIGAKFRNVLNWQYIGPSQSS